MSVCNKIFTSLLPECGDIARIIQQDASSIQRSVVENHILKTVDNSKSETESPNQVTRWTEYKRKCRLNHEKRKHENIVRNSHRRGKMAQLSDDEKEKIREKRRESYTRNKVLQKIPEKQFNVC